MSRSSRWSSGWYGTCVTHRGMHALQFRRGGEWAQRVERMGGGEQFDAQHACRVVADPGELAAGPRRHAHVIFLARRRRQAVHRGRVRVRLVLGDQRGCRDVRDHEARLEPGFGREEHVEVGVHAAVEQVDASLGRAREFRDGDREEIADEPDRLGVEVAAGQHVLAEDQRVVGDAVDGRAEHVTRVAQRMFDRAEHLWHAAHGVRILHALAVFVAATDLAVGIEQRADAPRGVDLSRQAARLLDAVVEGRVTAGETFHRHRAADHRGVEQRLGAEQAVECQRQAQLRAVEQRQPFLRLQFERLDASRAQHFDASEGAPVFGGRPRPAPSLLPRRSAPAPGARAARDRPRRRRIPAPGSRAARRH